MRAPASKTNLASLSNSRISFFSHRVTRQEPTVKRREKNEREKREREQRNDEAWAFEALAPASVAVRSIRDGSGQGVGETSCRLRSWWWRRCFQRRRCWSRRGGDGKFDSRRRVGSASAQNQLCDRIRTSAQLRLLCYLLLLPLVRCIRIDGAMEIVHCEAKQAWRDLASPRHNLT